MKQYLVKFVKCFLLLTLAFSYQAHANNNIEVDAQLFEHIQPEITPTETSLAAVLSRSRPIPISFLVKNTKNTNAVIANIDISDFYDFDKSKSGCAIGFELKQNQGCILHLVFLPSAKVRVLALSANQVKSMLISLEYTDSAGIISLDQIRLSMSSAVSSRQNIQIGANTRKRCSGDTGDSCGCPSGQVLNGLGECEGDTDGDDCGEGPISNINDSLKMSRKNDAYCIQLPNDPSCTGLAQCILNPTAPGCAPPPPPVCITSFGTCFSNCVNTLNPLSTTVAGGATGVVQELTWVSAGGRACSRFISGFIAAWGAGSSIGCTLTCGADSCSY
jgi:hypothetical protein